MLTVALTFAFFLMTFYFKADCFMVPKPGFCQTAAKSWFEKYFGWAIPSWANLFGALLGLALASPIPFVLTTLFRKFRVDEIKTDSQKRAQRNFWRAKQALGWTIALGLQSFCIYFLLLFSMQYDWIVYRVFLNAVIQGMIHRVFTSPLARGFALATALALSKYLSCCDCIIIFCCPHFIPEVDVKGGHREQNLGESAGQDGDDAGDDMDMDMDAGDGQDYDDGFDGGEDGGGADGFDLTSMF
jgi:hypothetical protein